MLRRHPGPRRASASVPAGTILGVLGPNGAGKTTTVRMLTTLTRPDAGRARVAGFDVVRRGDPVRRHIGVTGQNATLDELLTGRQNLVMMGELGGASAGRGSGPGRRAARAVRPRRRRRPGGQGLLGRHAAPARPGRQPGRPAHRCCSSTSPRPVSTPPAGRGMWEIIRDLVADGVTVLLTTQYLDEADTLADRIIVIDHGTGDRRGHRPRAQGHGRRRAARARSRPRPRPTRRSASPRSSPAR